MAENTPSFGPNSSFSPPVTIVEDTICPGQSALLVLDAGPDALVMWMKDERIIHIGDSLKTPPLSESTTYKTTYKFKDKGESNTVMITATVESLDNIVLDKNPRGEHKPNSMIRFGVNTSLSIQSFEWNLGDGTVDSLASPVHEYQHPGRYEVSVKMKTERGCTLSLKQLLDVKQPPYVDFPSAFSPNGDGFNDKLRINYFDLSSFILKIYDRNGHLIYETENPSFVWDGIDVYGDLAPEGVYKCQVQALTSDKKPINLSHTLTLVR